MIRVTRHAIDRYRERVEPCSKADAKDRLLHALSISMAMSESRINRLFPSRRGRRHAPHMHSEVCRYCPVESLMLVLRPKDYGMALLTVLRIPDERRKSA